jgi:HSP90 family molecular chaperone
MKYRLLLLTIIIFPVFLNAQNPVDFSGTWIQDNAKSDDFYKEFGITNVIVQTPQTISFRVTFTDKDGKEITTRESIFNLDGKEVSKEEQGGINKEQATWSPDKKTLTTKDTRTVGSDVYGSTTTYTLSEDGKELKVKTSDIDPMGLTVNQVFTRKK